MNGLPSSVCIIDWQLYRYGSPVLDILYYVFSATDKETRDKHYDNLLQLYYDALSKIVRRLGSDPDKLFTFNDLQDQLKICGKFVLIMPPLLLQIMMADANDVCNLDELSVRKDNGENIKVSLVTGINGKSKAEYIRRVKGLLDDVLRLNLISTA